MQDQQADLSWRSEVPVSRRFDDPYYSLENGLAETRHVFLAGNGLPERFSEGFRIAELGFGTGLNALVTAQAAPQRVHFTSFEAFPVTRDDARRAHAPFPELARLSAQLIAQWENDVIELDHLRLSVIKGDARGSVATWSGMADAWYLDGFSPAKNPELWDAELMRSVCEHTAEGGTFATYTAAGHVRRALAEAGFSVTRIPGFGRKRHMSVGRK